MNSVSSAAQLLKANEAKKKKSRSANLLKKGAELHSLQKVEVLIVLYDTERNQFSHYCSADAKDIFFGLLRTQENELQLSVSVPPLDVTVRHLDAPRKISKKRDASPAVSLKDLLSGPSRPASPHLPVPPPRSWECTSAKPSKLGVPSPGIDFEACSTKDSSIWDTLRGGALQPPSPTNLSHYSGSTPEVKTVEDEQRSEESRSQEDWLDQF